jgi:hypothetical protein
MTASYGIRVLPRYYWKQPNAPLFSQRLKTGFRLSAAKASVLFKICSTAYSGDVTDPFRRDVNGHSDDVNKVERSDAGVAIMPRDSVSNNE